MVLALICTACTAGTTSPRSETKNLVTTREKPLPFVTDVDTARAAAVRLGYLDQGLCAGGYKGGEELMFATGHQADTETGQGGGSLVARDGGIFFEQKSAYSFAPEESKFDLFTLGLAPGVSWDALTSSSSQSVQSNWELRSYASSVCLLAFNVNNTLKKPLYNSASAAIVAVEAGTSGLSAKYDELLKIVFTGQTPQQGDTRLTVYLKKAFGLVGLEIMATGVPDAYNQGLKTGVAFHLYINAQGGTGESTAITDSPALTKLLADYRAEKIRGRRLAAECQQIGETYDLVGCAHLFDIAENDIFSACAKRGGVVVMSAPVRCQTRLFAADVLHPEYLSKESCEKATFHFLRFEGQDLCWEPKLK